jgi:hypothetical protein
MRTEIVEKAKNGTLVFRDDGTFDYRPASRFKGTDTFTYVAIDGGLKSKPATVTIHVTSLVNEKLMGKIEVAKIQYRSGQELAAVASLKQIVKLYPKLPAADVAREQLKEWGQ